MLSIDLSGKRALVAGVADDGGFGFAIAKALAEAGARVCLGTWPPALGIFRIEVNSAFRSWFDADAPVIAADNAIRARFVGTSTIRVLVEGDAPDALLDPGVVRGMAALQDALRAEEAITGTVSLADYVQVMHRAFDHQRILDLVAEGRSPTAKLAHIAGKATDQVI